MAQKRKSLVCTWPGCGNTVARKNWEKQNKKCHIHKNMALSAQSAGTTGQSSNPFVDSSVIFPDLLESNYSELMRAKDRSPIAVRNASLARSMSNVQDLNGNALGYHNAKTILDTFNKFSNGQDLRIPVVARTRYYDGANLYAEMLSKSPYLKNCKSINLIEFKGLTVRPRNDGRKYSNPSTGEDIDLFTEQTFENRRHTAVLVEWKRSETDQRTNKFIVDPLITALAPVGDGKTSRIPTNENASLNMTPFGQSPWVASPLEYMRIDFNNSIGWESSKIVKDKG